MIRRTAAEILNNMRINKTYFVYFIKGYSPKNADALLVGKEERVLLNQERDDMFNHRFRHFIKVLKDNRIEDKVIAKIQKTYYGKPFFNLANFSGARFNFDHLADELLKNEFDLDRSFDVVDEFLSQLLLAALYGMERNIYTIFYKILKKKENPILRKIPFYFDKIINKVSLPIDAELMKAMPLMVLLDGSIQKLLKKPNEENAKLCFKEIESILISFYKNYRIETDAA